MLVACKDTLIINAAISSDDPSPVKGRSDIQISPECLLSDIPESELFDLVFVPGGLAAAEAFAASKAVGDLYTRHNNQNKLVAAICASPIALKYVSTTALTATFTFSSFYEKKSV